MADTPATTTGTSSTPTDAPASGTSPSTQSPAVTAPQTTTKPEGQTPPAQTTTTTGDKPAASDPAKPAESTETPKTDKPAADAAPLYTLPEDIKFQAPALKTIDTFLRSKLVDGKVVLTPQEAMDHFATQAREGQARWEQSIKDADAANKAICEKRFTPAQLTAAETGVAFLSSHDPAFRDWAKAQLNNPVFVNAMRDIGERLSEDSLETGETPSAPLPQKRSLSARMGYTKQ